jgi:trigger factor
MQTEVKEIGPCKLQIKIEVSADKIKEKLEEKYKKFVSSVVIPGFRKGFAPRDLIERKFGKDIKEELKNDTIISSCTDAFKKHSIEPITDPEIDFNKITLDESTPLSFDVIIEVKPTIDLIEYTGIQINRIKIEVTENDIDKAIEDIRLRHSQWQPVENQPAKQGSLVIFDQETFVQGKSIYHQENSSVIIGTGTFFFGKPVKEIGDSFIGLRKGNSKELTLKIPEDAKQVEYRSKEASIKVHLKEIKVLKTPQLTEEWTKSIGFNSISNMRETLKKRLLETKEEERGYQMEEQILETILQKTDFPLPESLVNDNINYVLKRWATNMLLEGLSEKEIIPKIEEIKPKVKEMSEKELRIQFICDHIAKKEKIFVTENEVGQKINELAGRYNKWPNEVRKYYEDNHLMGNLRAEIREGKVRKLLREKAVITD